MSAPGSFRKAAAEKVGLPDSERFLRILDKMMTEEQAQLIVSLPATPEELAKKINKDVATVNELLRDLFLKGIIVPKNFQTLEGMRFIPHPVGLHDRVCATRHMEPELLDLWNDFTENEICDQHGKLLAGSKELPRRRLLPYYKSIENNPDKTQYDDIREILKAAQLISVVPCSCRVRTRTCRKLTADVCMQFNRSAEYGIVRGTGRKLSLDEAMAVIDLAEERGLIHQWDNRQSLRGTTLCNCCTCCCIDIHSALPYKAMGNLWAKTRFLAKINHEICNGCPGKQVAACVAQCPECYAGSVKRVWDSVSGKPGDFKAAIDPDKCVGCGACVIKCPVGAITMETVRPLNFVPELPLGA